MKNQDILDNYNFAFAANKPTQLVHSLGASDEFRGMRRDHILSKEIAL